MFNQILLIVKIAALVVVVSCWIVCVVARNNKSISWKVCIIAIGTSVATTVMMSIFEFKHGDKVGFCFLIAWTVLFLFFFKMSILKLKKIKEANLIGSTKTGIIPSLYEGDTLTYNLKGLDLPRQEGESDWEYRQRVFPELYFKKGFTVAISMLMGCSVTELSDTEKMVLLSSMPNEPENMNSHGRKQFLFQLKNFARGFSEDPLKTRSK
ncbi:MAG: hypothetical protein PHE59_03785 [Patescibacteria group bacterium]|nr:hypothetical protein [Patescibacteria group bacterium]MDD5164770.1 hypothetical protein [Patescibacteria group bacterium]MDD5534414.1 hypothetical protein [Patescibacteria group bacterium]